MGKRIFWIFLLSVALATTVAVIYIQSEAFAHIVRSHVQSRVARNLGVELNFERLKIGVLPPSISLLNVDLKVFSAANKLGLGTDTVFKAGSLGFSFRMIQAFSSGIAVNKVFLGDATVKLMVPQNKSHDGGEKLSTFVHKPIRIQLSDSFFATIRQLEVRNSMLDLAWRDSGQTSRVFSRKISYLALTPSKEGTNLVLNAEDVEINAGKIKETIKAVQVNADVQKSFMLLSSLDVQRREAALHASGKLVGSIDNLSEARPDVDIILRGPINELADLERSLDSFGGEFIADAKIVGRLKAPELQGHVEIKNFSYGLWKLDQIEFSGSYGQGILVGDSLSIANGGGKAFLKNKMEVQFPFKLEPAIFQLGLENAKFEDFAGDLKKSVNNLRMQMDGTVNARLDFTESGGKVGFGALTLKPDLGVKDLELNNQTYGKVRPYKRILKVAPFRLGGNVLIKDGSVDVSGAQLSFASGSLDVSGTHTRQDGFDITGAAAKINIGLEAGEISGIPIKGEGALKIHVHGTADDVKIDFDVNQQNAQFIHFDFGKLEGRVTYDDKHDLILIPGVTGHHGSAAYSVNGSVDLTDKDNISLNAAFEESAPDDLFGIFAHQLEHISWIPRGMTGLVRGKVTVGGKYSSGLSTLEIDSRITGRNLSYKGEVFQDLEAHAGVTGGVAFGHEIRAKKYDTPYSGSIDYNLKTDEMRYVLDAERGKLRSLDFLTATGISLDGVYALHSEGHGRWETLVSKSRFDVSNGFVRTRPLPPISLSYETTAETSTYSAKLGPAAMLSGQIAHSPQGESFAQISLQKANLDFLLCMLSRTNCSDDSLNFTVTGAGNFRWKGWDWFSMSGTGALQDLLMAKTGYNLRVNNAVPITALNGFMESGQGMLEGEDTRIGFRFRGRVDGSKLDNSVRGAASLKVLEFVTPLIKEARGHMRVDVAVTGDLENANFRGNVNMEEGMLRIEGLDASVDNLEAHLKLEDSHLKIDSLTGQLGGGTMQVSGGMNLYLNRPPKFGIDLYLANNRIKFYPVNFAEISDGKLNFSGEAPPYLFSGTVRAKKVMMHNNFDLSRGQKGLQNAKYLPEKVAGVKSFYEVRILGLADSGIFVDNNLLNAEFRGEVKLMNNFEFPEIVGHADLVRGKLLFRNTFFTLDHASLQVPNPDVFNPQFLITGSANLDSYRINILASGTVDRPKITLSSYPALPQEDIVSLLAFGYRGEDARKVNPNDTSAITYSEMGSILLEQLQLSQSLQSKGLRVTVAPAVIDPEASIIRPNSSATAAPKVYVQSQVMKNLEAVLGGTVGAAAGQSMDAKLEYRLGQRASMRGVYEQSSSGLDATETKNNSYGADLKFRWEFK